MSREPCQIITEHLAAACAPAGFDLVQPLRASWYNEAVAAQYRLPDQGRADALAVLIGNTRALWQPFVAAVRGDPALAADPHPLDRYTRERIHAAMSSVAAPWELRFSFEPPPRRVAMQRLAQAAGLAYLSPSYLSVHPVYGPWIALRAVAVIDVPGPAGPAPALDREPPCRCDASCLPWLRRAMATIDPSGASDQSIAESWRAWVAVRDACPVGREHRYGEAQIRYHYTKDRQLFRDADREGDGEGDGGGDGDADGYGDGDGDGV